MNDSTANLPVLYDDTREWDDQALTLLRHGQPATVSDIPSVPAWTQSAWDRRQVQQLRAAEECVDELADSDGIPGSVVVRNLLLRLGKTRAAHDHMEATAAEDAGSFYALMVAKREAQTIEPAKIHTPGRRRKTTAPRRDRNGRFAS